MVTVVKRFIAFYGIISANLNSEKLRLTQNFLRAHALAKEVSP